jgi:hypothetical protein
VHGYDVRIIHATTGEIIRTLTINLERRYLGHRRTHRRTTTPLRTPKTKKPDPNEGSGPCRCLTTSHLSG